MNEHILTLTGVINTLASQAATAFGEEINKLRCIDPKLKHHQLNRQSNMHRSGVIWVLRRAGFSLPEISQYMGVSMSCCSKSYHRFQACWMSKTLNNRTLLEELIQRGERTLVKIHQIETTPSRTPARWVSSMENLQRIPDIESRISALEKRMQHTETKIKFIESA